MTTSPPLGEGGVLVVCGAPTASASPTEVVRSVPALATAEPKRSPLTSPAKLWFTVSLLNGNPLAGAQKIAILPLSVKPLVSFAGIPTAITGGFEAPRNLPIATAAPKWAVLTVPCWVHDGVVLIVAPPA